GDLDDFFWPSTAWHGLKTNTGLTAVALLYAAPSLPVLLALSEEPVAMRELLTEIRYLLPPRFYTHLSPGLETDFKPTHALDPHGEYYKMALIDTTSLSRFQHPGAVKLGDTDLPAILKFYAQSYPGNWFDPRMLQTGQFFGIKEKGDLVSIAGIHVYSPCYKVAALGNITTRPDFRGKSYGALVTAAVCGSLLKTVDHIGLNVKADNAAAIACYRKLGFEVIGSYNEFILEKKT
ncbi:MAG: GNAT family N-acetyltransferase, partial [Desulfobacteraceae bacterium]